MATKVDITIEQGSRFDRIFLYCDPIAADPDDPDPAAPVDVSGWAAKMQIRERAGAEAVLLEASTADGKITVGSEPGQFHVLISGADTAALERDGYYDLYGIPPEGGSPERVAEGAVFVSPSVTVLSA